MDNSAWHRTTECFEISGLHSSFLHIISFDPAELLVEEKPGTIAVYWKVELRLCFWN